MTVLRESKVLTIRIEMTGGAFDEYPTGEVERILTEAVGRLDTVGVEHHAGELFTLFDLNGHACGTVKLGR